MSRFTTLISRKKALEILQKRFLKPRGGTQNVPHGESGPPESGDLTIGIINAGNPGEVLPEPCRAFIPGQTRIREYQPVSLDPEGFSGSIQQAAAECQAVLVAGILHDEKEPDPGDIQALTGTVLFHGVAIHPGSGMMAADARGVPVFFLPPGLLAGSVICREFLTPLIRSWGYPVPEEHTVMVEFSDSFPGELGQDDYLPVTVARIGGRLIAVPAGGETEDARCRRGNGILHITEWKEGCAQGTNGPVILYRNPSHIDRQILVAGIASAIVPKMAEKLSETGYQLSFRHAPPVIAATRFSHRHCHGVLLPGPVGELGTATLALLGPVEELTAIHAGDEALVLCFAHPPDAPSLADIQAVLPARIPDAGIFVPGEGSDRGLVFREMPDADAVIRAVSAGKGVAGICYGYRAQEAGLAVHPVGTRPVFFFMRTTDEVTILDRFFSELR